MLKTIIRNIPDQTTVYSQDMSTSNSQNNWVYDKQSNQQYFPGWWNHVNKLRNWVYDKLSET